MYNKLSRVSHKRYLKRQIAQRRKPLCICIYRRK